MQSRLSEEAIEEYREVFSLFVDKKGDESIPISKLGSILRSVTSNPTEAQILDIISTVDPKGEGRCHFRDFLKVMERQIIGDDGEDLIKAFRQIDKQKTGLVSHGEFISVMKSEENLSDLELKEIFAYVEFGGDGRIDYEKFAKFLFG